MIYEMAEIEIQPGKEAEFEAAARKAAPLFQAATGYHSFALHRSIEHPGKYRLIVGWESVDHHMVEFRNSPNFQQWRALVGGFFANPPQVEHTDEIIKAG
ncbi:MAG: antibiotic biosynthesis monooxygenase family protein [Hyphomonadaceae bacterium]|nr:antibiotic biosynthesis monooxygenase family protein [Hyphomonadaceae bacterium]